MTRATATAIAFAALALSVGWVVLMRKRGEPIPPGTTAREVLPGRGGWGRLRDASSRSSSARSPALTAAGGSSGPERPAGPEEDVNPAPVEQDLRPEEEVQERELRFQEVVGHFEALPRTSTSSRQERDLAAAFSQRFADSGGVDGVVLGHVSCGLGQCSVEARLAPGVRSGPLIAIARQVAADIAGESPKPLLSSFSVEDETGETTRRIFYHFR